MKYTYVCSDLHGMYDKYIALVNTLKNSDELYIIGDVINRGNDGIKILQDIIKRDNVHMTLGNHEFLLREDLNQLAGCEKHEINKIISDSLEIGNIGQIETLICYQFAIIKHCNTITMLN